MSRSVLWMACLVMWGCDSDKDVDDTSELTTWTPTTTTTPTGTTSTPTGTKTGTSTPTTTTEPPLSCEDIDGDGRPDFDKDAPIHVEVGLGETDCMLGDDAGDVILFSGPQGGYHVDACFIVEGVPQEVFFVTKITIEPEGIQVAGSDETIDRTGVGLIDWTDKDCSGYYVGARGLIDDLWPTWPTLTEVCEWEGLDVTVEVEIIDYATDRRGYASLVRPAMVMGADGPIDCDAITTGTGTGTGTSTGTTTGTGTGTSTGTTTGTTSTTTGS